MFKNYISTKIYFFNLEFFKNNFKCKLSNCNYFIDYFRKNLIQKYWFAAEILIITGIIAFWNTAVRCRYALLLRSFVTYPRNALRSHTTVSLFHHTSPSHTTPLFFFVTQYCNSSPSHTSVTRFRHALSSHADATLLHHTPLPKCYLLYIMYYIFLDIS